MEFRTLRPFPANNLFGGFRGCHNHKGAGTVIMGHRGPNIVICMVYGTTSPKG